MNVGVNRGVQTHSIYFVAVNDAVKTMLPLISLYIAAQGLGVCVDHLLRVSKKPVSSEPLAFESAADEVFKAMYPGLVLRCVC